MDLQLIKECEAKAQAWLSSPYYDEETKAEIREMMQNEDKTALIDAFYQTWSSVLADCVASWALAPTA